MRRVLHGAAAIEQYRQLAIGLTAVALQIRTLRACEHVPIDMPQIVPGSIGPIFGKLLAEAEIGRAVQTGDEPIDHGASDQVKTGDSGKYPWIQETLKHGEAPRAYSLGAGIASSNLLKMS